MDRSYFCRWCRLGFERNSARVAHQMFCYNDKLRFAKKEINTVTPKMAFDLVELRAQLDRSKGLAVSRDCDEKKRTGETPHFVCEICGASLVQYFGCKNPSCNLK